MMVPILKCFEQTYLDAHYFHTENKILSDQFFLSAGGLRNLVGLTDINWRRFEEKNWNKIISFIKENQIDTVINLRNEGPKFDTNYYNFKNKILNQLEVGFYELDFSEEVNQLEVVSIEKKIINLLKRLKVDFYTFNREWLKYGKLEKSGIVCVLAASQENKRLLEKNWITFLNALKTNEQIFLVPGTSKDEVKTALSTQINSKIKTSLVLQESLSSLVGLISKAKIVVSNDTGLLHIAAAVGTKAVGLYISTNSKIWAPQSTLVTIFQSEHYGKCEYLKKNAGNCLCYYRKCLTIQGRGDGIDMERVVNVVEQAL